MDARVLSATRAMECARILFPDCSVRCCAPFRAACRICAPLCSLAHVCTAQRRLLRAFQARLSRCHVPPAATLVAVVEGYVLDTGGEAVDTGVLQAAQRQVARTSREQAARALAAKLLQAKRLHSEQTAASQQRKLEGVAEQVAAVAASAARGDRAAAAAQEKCALRSRHHVRAIMFASPCGRRLDG